MLSEQEQNFIRYWEANRLNKKRFLRQFTIAFPLSVLFIVLLFANLLSGWYKKADMEFRANSSLFIVILIAALGIVIFMVSFSSKHKWEQNEQRYKELKARQEKEL